MRFFPILFFSLFAASEALAQPACAALPAKPPVPVGSTTKNPNQAAMAAALNSADMAAKKLQFETQKAKLDADPTVQALRIKHQQQLSAATNDPDFQKKKLEMANQIAVAQSSSSFQDQKARFNANLKCSGQ